jgi:hypothetical protein
MRLSRLNKKAEFIDNVFSKSLLVRNKLFEKIVPLS